MKVRRHRFISAIVYPHRSRPYRPTLLRPVSLVDVFERHPEWHRRCVLTMRAKRDGRPIPTFPLLYPCARCGRDFVRTSTRKLCPSCLRREPG